jgi:hypothetical protein
MAESIDQAKLEVLLKRVGLIDARYSGPIQVTAKTSTGTQSITIKV